MSRPSQSTCWRRRRQPAALAGSEQRLSLELERPASQQASKPAGPQRCRPKLRRPYDAIHHLAPPPPPPLGAGALAACPAEAQPPPVGELAHECPFAGQKVSLAAAALARLRQWANLRYEEVAASRDRSAAWPAMDGYGPPPLTLSGQMGRPGRASGRSLGGGGGLARAGSH